MYYPRFRWRHFPFVLRIGGRCRSGPVFQFAQTQPLPPRWRHGIHYRRGRISLPRPQPAAETPRCHSPMGLNIPYTIDYPQAGFVTEKTSVPPVTLEETVSVPL